MQIRYLNGNRLYYAFLAGAQSVIRQQDYLNKINVFPVPDADTGNNLASTFRAIMTSSKPTTNLAQTSRSIADAALIGARGNAGIIFAQFIYGFASEVGDRHRMSVSSFIKAIMGSVKYAYEALSHPVEGTILTVIKDWAAELHRFEKEEIQDFTEMLNRSYHAAKQSLKDTPKKLKVLAKAGVVDAGAKGFVDFLDGIRHFVKKGDIRDIADFTIPEVQLEAHILDSSDDIPFRYCTEAILEGNHDLDKAAIRRELESFGDSLIVAGSERKVHVHVHTNRPADLYTQLYEYGTLLHQKVDDMRMQYEISHHRRANIAVVTDSACDLPRALLEEYQIHMIPLKLVFGDSSFLDKVTIEPEQFYSMLDGAKQYPTTSQPSLVEFENLYSYLLSHYDSVIAVHLSRELSGTWNASRKAAEKINRDRIRVVNSKNLSGALGLIVLRLAQSIDAGRSQEEMLKDLDEWVDKTRIYVSVPSLKYMVRGGRVSPMKGMVAKLLNLKPIVSLDREGHSKLYDKSFSRQGSLKKMMKLVERFQSAGKVWNYSIFHAHAREHAEEYREQLVALLGKEPVYIMDISPIIGLNAGLGAVSVAVMHE